MHYKNTGETLKEIISQNASSDTIIWIEDKLSKILVSSSARELYLSYSLLSGKVDGSKSLNYRETSSEVSTYLEGQGANLLQVSRIYLLIRALEENKEYFAPKVANLIQVADTGELETFLKFLVLLPHGEQFKNTAVEALRTNIATVFDAISLNNPYPSMYFNNQQWNQMYLKAAFMQRNLGEIIGVDEKANKDLARIISDYAHERWAASRDVDPQFWRPVSNFIEGPLLDDMKRLLKSDTPAERSAGALCCFHSNLAEAKQLLEGNDDILAKIKNQEISWSKLKA